MLSIVSILKKMNKNDKQIRDSAHMNQNSWWEANFVVFSEVKFIFSIRHDISLMENGFQL